MPAARLPAAALALALAAWAAPAGAADLDPLVPGDATAVASVNVRGLLDAPLVRKHALPALQTALKQNANAQTVLGAAGVDPFRDVDRVVVAGTGFEPDKVLFIVHGRFDPDKAQAAAADFAAKHPDQLKIDTEGGLRLYENRMGKAPTFGAFVGKDTVLLSRSRAAVVSAAGRAGKGPAEPGKELKALLAKVDMKATAWAVAVAPPELKRVLKKNENTADVADKLESLAAALDVGQDFRAALHIYVTDAKAASDIAEMLDGVRNLAKLVTQNNARFGDLLGDALDGAKIDTAKDRVDLTVQLSGERIDKDLGKKKAPAPGAR